MKIHILNDLHIEFEDFVPPVLESLCPLIFRGHVGIVDVFQVIHFLLTAGYRAAVRKQPGDGRRMRVCQKY